MNVLFLTMNVFTDIEMHNIYSDLMKEFTKHGHRPYIVTPREKKLGEKTELIDYDDYSILKVQIGNTSKVSMIEKGISTVTLSSKFYNAIKSKLGNIRFGLLLYSTPPITLAVPVKRLKKLFKCKTYLMLKDIFPQNAVDLGMFSSKGVIYHYFRSQEKLLYEVSDKIGCMSPANIDYLKEHNKEIAREKIELLPNCIIPYERNCTLEEKENFHKKYGISLKDTVFMYGGNLGKPQDIPFVVRCMEAMKDELGCYFIICGTGSEYALLENFMKINRPTNISLINGLPKKDYDELLRCCDVGLLFLDHRFTIPNFPSRMLSYMECSIPVLACTDCNTDVGKVVEQGEFGVWCSSDSVVQFQTACRKFIGHPDLCAAMGKAGRRYLEKNYVSKIAYDILWGNINTKDETS